MLTPAALFPADQLRTGGDPDFKDIYAEVPWPEFKERPDQPDEELLERWEKMPSPRAFKTHSMPGPKGVPMPKARGQHPICRRHITQS